jgi:2-dehydropantoate 2-reductase
MRHVVYGAGAVGGVIGARLQLAGIATTVVARGEHLTRIRDRGLLLDTQDGQEVVDLPATDTAADIDWTDDTVVLLTVKSHQTEAVLDDLEAHAPEGTVVVSAQNGVANEAAILRRFARTYAVCVMLPALHLEPGVVVQKSHPTPGILDVGRFPTRSDSTAEAIAADLRAAGFASRARPDIMAWKYRKLLTNAVGDVSTLFTPDDGSDELARAVAAEGDAVLAAAGVVAVTAEADATRRGDLLQQRADVAAYPGNSLAQSLARGLATEIHYRVGELVLLGRLHGVPTPACERVLRTALSRP